MSAIQTPTGRRIFYDDLGKGSPLLFIPGAMSDRRGWMAPLTTALATRHRVIAMDLRDSGESEPETDYYSLDDLVADAIALLDALAIDRVHVVGYSLGGVVAQQVALDYPHRVDRLVVISSFAYSIRGHRPDMPMPLPEDWWSDDAQERTRNTIPGIVGPAYRQNIGDAELAALAHADRDNRITWQGLMRQQAAQADVDLRPRLGEVRAPTLVIHGEVDPAILLERGQVVAEYIPGAQLCVLAGVGHMPWIDRPDDVTSAILDFLAESDSTDA